MTWWFYRTRSANRTTKWTQSLLFTFKNVSCDKQITFGLSAMLWHKQRNFQNVDSSEELRQCYYRRYIAWLHAYWAITNGMHSSGVVQVRLSAPLSAARDQIIDKQEYRPSLQLRRCAAALVQWTSCSLLPQSLIDLTYWIGTSHCLYNI